MLAKLPAVPCYGPGESCQGTSATSHICTPSYTHTPLLSAGTRCAWRQYTIACMASAQFHSVQAAACWLVGHDLTRLHSSTQRGSSRLSAGFACCASLSHHTAQQVSQHACRPRVRVQAGRMPGCTCRMHVAMKARMCLATTGGPRRLRTLARHSDSDTPVNTAQTRDTPQCMLPMPQPPWH